MTDFSTSPPEPVAYVTGLLAGLDVPWLLCGGSSADAWLGRQTRSHADVDVGVFREDQRAVFEHFPGSAQVGHNPNVPDATTQQWNGRRLDLPAHVHVTVLGSNLSTQPSLTHSKVEFEFLLSERPDGDWVLNTERRIAVPADPWWTPLGHPRRTAGGHPVLQRGRRPHRRRDRRHGRAAAGARRAGLPRTAADAVRRGAHLAARRAD